MYHDAENDIDVCRVYQTGGSNGSDPDKLVTEFRG